jgi:hypothetical protein
MPTITSGFYAITDADGMVLAVLVDWRLGLAQEIARTLRAATAEDTFLHHLFALSPPTVGDTVSMTNPGLKIGATS